ncbi:relaxase/mobilization nuclease domain-containing protein [Mucilaginibacter sp. CSA2-8R]|uniref:relaxase/mobilization nuclease domain-containing protein n=1 Tax=Mucilaginibacter sp. CSA2-8R TaxID=3141542 RepID=UPI00315D7A56
MVAKIKTGRSILGAINYNEHKVRLGKAELILAQGYLKDPSDLSFSDKLHRLTDLTKRNQRTLVNALHVSLNFAVGENLDKDTLQQIADEYMEGLGFGRQPYLVYQHYDAGHPHLHLVSTNIKPNGERISFHLLANRASERSRKQVELNYGLVKAEDQRQAEKIAGKLSLEPIVYGKSETKRAITNVISGVIRNYKFTSLAEFNAVLNQYNVLADRGAKDTRIYDKNGLVYWALDANGNKIGVPIKASSIYGKPTLQTLTDRFRLNEIMRKPLKPSLITALDHSLQNHPARLKFEHSLKAQGIDAVIRKNPKGMIYGLTFIDHNTGGVFKGSDLGKRYSASNLAAIFRLPGPAGQVPPQESSIITKTYLTNEHVSAVAPSFITEHRLLKTLYQEEYTDFGALAKLKQNKRRKKRRGHSL